MKLFSLALILIACLAQTGKATDPDPANPRPENLDFEDGEIGKSPSQWKISASPSRTSSKVEVTGWHPFEGDRCAQITLLENDGSLRLYQTIDAREFRGGRLRFTTNLRTLLLEESEGSRVELFGSVEGPDSNLEFGLGSPAYRSRTWRSATLLLDVGEDAERLTFGIHVAGRGSAWVDGISFEMVSDLPQQDDTLAPHALLHLEAFSKLLGLVRYFHPSDGCSQTDWNSFAIHGVRLLEQANDPESLAETLSQIFSPIAPTLRFFTTTKPELPEALLRPDDWKNLSLTYWVHRGLGSPPEEVGSIYSSRRAVVPLEVSPEEAETTGGEPPPPAPPNLPHFASLPGGVNCLIPLTLYRDARGTRPHRASPSLPAVMDSPHDRSARWATVALLWSTLQHFYPYFEEIDCDWEEVLRQGLTAASPKQSREEFHHVLSRLIASLHDGQAEVRSLSGEVPFALPFALDWIEDRLVVTQVDPDRESDLLPGDLLLEIDDRPVTDLLADFEERTPGATPQWRRLRAIDEVILGPAGPPLSFRVHSVNGRTWSLTESRNISLSRWYELQKPLRNPVREVEPGLYVVDLERMTDSLLRQALPDLGRAQGIVFDVRGYPRILTGLLRHLIDTPIESPTFCVPVATRPDRVDLVHDCSRWTVSPMRPQLSANRVFLVDSRSVAAAETLLAIVDRYELGELVGEPTAGTNGNVQRFRLPGNFEGSFTALKTLRHDGGTHHGVGILPNLPVSKTVRGIVAGKDEILERGLEIVRDRMGLEN